MTVATSKEGLMSSLSLMVQLPQQKKSIMNLKILLSLSGCGLALFFVIYQMFVTQLDGADAPECRMAYMAPTYAKVHGFDLSHTKYASKYSLYLYREQGKDADPDGHSLGFLDGVPALFIPGNAGSYKQVRAFAAECANMYLDQYKGHNKGLNPNAKNIDFFTADFNEDFTAFHGRTLLDQSEYLNDAIRFILSLYAANDVPAKSIIVVGHSMGGIVARTMISLPNYVNGSINTFITLAAPHAAPPVSFDGDLMKVYSSVDTFWRAGFSDSDYHDSKMAALAKRRLKDVALISITGGLSDTVLPADYTSIKGLVPEENGFTVYTSGIPGVWTPIDHLAIVWCDQLRKSLAKTLFEVIDTGSPYKTYPLEKKMRIFRSRFLSGFEDYVARDYASSKADKINFTVKLKVDNDQISSAIPGERSLITPPNYSSSIFKRGQRTPKMNFFYLPEESHSKQDEQYEFTALSSLPFENIDDFGKSAKPVVMLCRNAATNKYFYNEDNMRVVDFTDEATSKGVELDCIDASENAHQVPRSAINTVSTAESSIGGKFPCYNVLQFNSTTLSNFELVVIGESPNFYSLENSQDFVVADLVKSQNANVRVNARLWKFLLFGVEIKLPAKRPLAVDVSIPSIWSSLIAYNLRVVRQFEKKVETKPDHERFGPLIRQWIPDIFETKWLVGLNNEPDKLISLHSIAPFVPFEKDKEKNSLHLQVWSDSMSSKNLVTLRLHVDVLTSLRLMVMRFRLVVGTMPIAIVAMILAYQFWIYIATGRFMSFGEALVNICEPRILAIIVASLSSLSLMASNSAFKRILYMLDPIGLNNIRDHNLVRKDMELNPFFLGLEEDSLLLLGPIFFMISLGFVGLVYQICLFLANLAATIYCFFWITGTPQAASKRSKHKAIYNAEKFFFSSKKRLVGTLLIVTLVPFYIPYQLGYAVLVLAQFYVCFNGMVQFKQLEAQQPSAFMLGKFGHIRTEVENYKNFGLSFLMLVLWILPVNIPILIVFIHNFALKWKTPFSSHHNFLAIVPIFVVIEKCINGQIPPRLSIPHTLLSVQAIPQIVTVLILGYMSFYALVFGVRHAWWLHYLLNFFCTWLIFLNFDIWGVNVPTTPQSATHNVVASISSGNDTVKELEKRRSSDFNKNRRSTDLSTIGSKVY